MGKFVGVIWTSEDRATLRDLWKEGVPTAEIGRRMGRTKNSVIGEAYRLNLPSRGSPLGRNSATNGGNKHAKNPRQEVSKEAAPPRTLPSKSKPISKRANSGMGVLIMAHFRSEIARAAEIKAAQEPRKHASALANPLFTGRTIPTGRCMFPLWPTGEKTPDRSKPLFCGAEREGIFHVYCTAHANICFVRKDAA